MPARHGRPGPPRAQSTPPTGEPSAGGPVAGGPVAGGPSPGGPRAGALSPRGPVAVSVPARVGLVGHPSDGYRGATLAVTLSNFAAAVEIRPATRLVVEPAGPGEWPEGGLPLIRATIRRFRSHASDLGAPFDPLVAVRYGTTIPREVGLGGSSAIVIATLRALAAFAGLPIARDRLPGLALSVETDELGIAAGLQDRVVQAYGGLVFMDFAAGRHEVVDPALLPPLFVAWDESAAAGSGAAHAAVRARHAAGDRAVVDGMRSLAALAMDGLAALQRADHEAFAEAMAAGYAVRARIFYLDPRHTAMVDEARRLGLVATYTGSGGAIVGIASDRTAVGALAERLADRGIRLVGAVTQAG